MKKYFLWIVIIFNVFFVYEYQKPLMTTEKAIKQAIECVNNPPKRLAINPYNHTVKDLQAVHTTIEAKSGFLSKLTNQRELSVTLVLNEMEPTVKMNAYSGKCLKVTGPYN